MQSAALAAIRMVPVWIVVVGGLSLAAGFTIAALFERSGPLASDVRAVLTQPAEQREAGGDRGDLVLVHDRDVPPSGVWRGIQFGLLGLLLGGVPAACLAGALRWKITGTESFAGWGSLFFAGFVFQLSSFALATFLLGLVIWATCGSADGEVRKFAALLLVGVLSGGWGLRSWRVLQHQAEATARTLRFVDMSPAADAPSQFQRDETGRHPFGHQ